MFGNVVVNAPVTCYNAHLLPRPPLQPWGRVGDSRANMLCFAFAFSPYCGENVGEFVLFDLILYVPVINFSVMLGRVFLG